MRKIEAEIVLAYDDSATAKAVADAVSPDNSRTPRGLTVATARTRRRVITNIRCRKKLSTFIATVDDLLSSASIAEKTVQAAVRASKHASEPSAER